MSECNSGAVVAVKHAMADSALLVHIAVVDGSDEADLGRAEWVVAREISIQEEQSIFIGSLLGTQ